MSKKSRNRKARTQKPQSPSETTPEQPDSQPDPPPAANTVPTTVKKSGGKLGLVLIMSVLGILVIAGAIWGINVYFNVEAYKETSKKLKIIAFAMHSYNDRNRTLPPATFPPTVESPGLSWRVALLPSLGHENLYSEFHLDEPWDSEHNKPLLNKMPAVYKHPYASTNDLNNGLTTFSSLCEPG